MQVKVRWPSFFRRPRRISVPGIGACLESTRLPLWLLSRAVQVITKKRRKYLRAEFHTRVMPAERNDSQLIALATPAAVKPRTGHHQVGVIRIMFHCVAENLPRSPRIFLVPETCHVKVRNRGRMQLVDPRFFLPEIVIVRMLHGVIPEGERPMQ